MRRSARAATRGRSRAERTRVTASASVAEPAPELGRRAAIEIAEVERAAHEHDGRLELAQARAWRAAWAKKVAARSRSPAW